MCACVYLELELLAGGLVVLAADRRGEERDERDDSAERALRLPAPLLRALSCSRGTFGVFADGVFGLAEAARARVSATRVSNDPRGEAASMLASD